jgi:hypothetical protein
VRLNGAPDSPIAGRADLFKACKIGRDRSRSQEIAGFFRRSFPGYAPLLQVADAVPTRGIVKTGL